MKKIFVLFAIFGSVAAQASDSLLGRDLKLQSEVRLDQFVALSPELCLSYSRKVDFPVGSNKSKCLSAIRSFKIKNSAQKSVGKCVLAAQPAFDEIRLAKGLVLHVEDSFGSKDENGNAIELMVVNTVPAMTTAAVFLMCDENLKAEDVIRSMNLK